MFERSKHFTNWAIFIHLLYILFPDCFPNTFSLALFVLIGAEIIRQWIVKVGVTKQRKYKKGYLFNHLVLHWVPMFVVLFTSLLRKTQCNKLFNVKVILVPLFVYVIYMNFDFKRILFHYQYLDCAFDEYKKITG